MTTTWIPSAAVTAPPTGAAASIVTGFSHDMRALAHPASFPPGRVPHVDFRKPLRDGSATTLHMAAFPIGGVTVQVARLSEGETLLRWCRRTGVAHAIVGGFFVRLHNDRWASCGSTTRASSRCRSRRHGMPSAHVCTSAPAVTDGDDEGFTAGARQFDSDISDGRHPRCALALTPEHLLAVAADGRHAGESALTLGELADALVDLGARSAVNLDGGGSASLVCDSKLINRPRELDGIELLDGRALATALVLSALV